MFALLQMKVVSSAAARFYLNWGIHMYDTVVIGGGIIGSLLLRKLSRYKLKILLIEKSGDIADGASMANSAIIHAGYDPVPGTKKAYYNPRGCEMYPSLAKELDFLYKPLPSIVAAYSPEQLDTVASLYERGLENGVKKLSMIGRNKLMSIEPNISASALGALHAGSAGIIEPWGAAIAAAENAVDNGAELSLDEEVIAIEKEGDGFIVRTPLREYRTRTVVNAAGVFSDKIHDMVCPHSFSITGRKGQYILFDRSVIGLIRNTLFPCPTKLGKGILITPTIHDKLMIGPDSMAVDDPDTPSTSSEALAYIKEKASEYISCPLPLSKVIRTFAGIRPTPDTKDFIIGEDPFVKGFFDAAGIESPGLASAPAIAEDLGGKIADALGAAANPDFDPYRRKQIRLNRLSDSEKASLISENSGYASIVCKCEIVSEAEIVDSIHRNAGARTVKGVKKRSGAGFGRCQAGFCQAGTVAILSRELGIPKEKVRYGDIDSEILTGLTKQGC